MTHRRQNFMGGAAILALAVAVTKLLGALYKIPLGNLLDREGMAHFYAAYNIYSLLLVLSTAGLPVALSRMVARAAAQRRFGAARRCLRTGLALLGVMGLACSAVMCLLPDTLAAALHDGDAASALRTLGPAVLLVCLSAALRGYTQGLGDMVPTAAGQVAESTGKLTVGLALCLYLLHRGAGAPLCAAGAIGGVTAGAGLGLLVTALLLRSAEGCPWDRVQTHQSIRRGLLEEAYEAAEAIDTEDTALLREELGDVLMQVVFHADIEKDAGRFTMDDVCDGVVKKLLFRHPHVFGDGRAETADTVPASWDELKRQEKGQKTTADALDAVARSLPGLWRAEKIQKKAADAGFDWRDVSGALDKLDEETGELRQAVETGGDVAGELGDVLFAAVKVGRFRGIDPEDAIAGTCEKFIRRFRVMEQEAARQGRALHDMTLEEMTALWNGAKERS